MVASLLFRKAITGVAAPAIRRNIVTTPVRRSADPLIGHVEQEAIPGAVNNFKFLKQQLFIV